MDFRFAIQKYISEGFENFYLQFFPPQTDIVVRELKKQNIEPNHIFGSGMDSGSNMDLFENLNHLGGSSGTPEFVERLKQEYHVDNNYMAAPAYDLISLAIDAFENVENKKDIDKLIAYIKTHASRKGMSGQAKLLKNGFIANEGEWRTYRKGKIVVFGDK